MCTVLVLLPPGDNPIAINKYIISYIPISFPYWKQRVDSSVLPDVPLSVKWFELDETE